MAKLSRAEAPSYNRTPSTFYFPSRLTLHTSPLKLNTLLSLDTLIFKSMFNHFHFSNGVGEVDELLWGVAAGDDGVLHFWAGL